MQIDNDIYRKQRLENMRSLIEAGYKPFGHAFKRTGSLAEIRKNFEENKTVSVAGRLMTIRQMGKSTFADLRDGTDRFQIYVGLQIVGELPYKAFHKLDIGDHIGVAGKLFTTRTGEKTINVESWTLLSKALLPLPEKWHGLKDVEARYRQRYLDLVANPEVREHFNKRSEIIREIRAFLTERGFIEVETPMMQPQAGGAAAKPFVTNYTALGCEMFLRIAPELYLKRLLVGGYDKIFELNRNFRNEGLSRTHNPEFTMLEIYEAYSDVRGMKELVKTMIQHVAKQVCGTLKVGNDELAVDLSGEWREVLYKDLIKEKMGDDWFNTGIEEARKRAKSIGLEIDPSWDHLLITHEVYEKTIEKTLINPTFVMRFPSRLIPLAKTCEDDVDSADVFELVIRGQEVAPAYSELNDPIAQRQKLEVQAGENREKVDEDFITALEYGMPPAGGMGVGIDRLVMILLGIDSIRDVILFPQLKPKS